MEKLLAVASLTQRIYGRYLFRHLLSGLIVVAGLTVISSVMISAVLIGGSYAFYFALQHYGVGPDHAMFAAGALLTLITAILAGLTVWQLRRLRTMPQRLIKQSPLTARASETVDAFLNGFMQKDY